MSLFSESTVSRSKLRSAAEWLHTALLAGNLVWSCLCLGGYRPDTQVLTYSLGALLVFVHLILRSLGLARSALRITAADWLLAAFLVYAAVQALWLTPFPWLAWPEVIGWAQMIACFWILRSECMGAGPRRFLWAVLLALGVVAVAMGLYQRFANPHWLMLGRTQADQFLNRASGFFGIPNSMAGFLALLIPSTFACCVRPRASLVQRVFFGYLALLYSLGFILTISRGGWLALTLAVAVWPLLVSRASLIRRLGASVIVALCSALLVGALSLGSPAFRERVDAVVRDSGESSRPMLWKASWLLFCDSPWTGTGAASFNVLFERHRPEHFQREPQWAHNEYLNTLSDYGLLGFSLFFGALACFAWKSLREPFSAACASSQVSLELHPWVRQGFVIGVLAFCLQLFFDFHLKLPALALSFVCVAMLALPGVCLEGPSREPFMRRVWYLGAALILLGLFLWQALPMLRAEALRYPTRQRMEVRLPRLSGTPEAKVLLADSQGVFERATRLSPRHGQCWADFSYSLALWSREQPDQTMEYAKRAEIAARHALALGTESPEFWVRLGVAQNMQGRWEDAGLSFSRAISLAPSSLDMNFYLAYHYSLRASTQTRAKALIETCLRLDPSYAPAQTLRAQMASSWESR